MAPPPNYKLTRTLITRYIKAIAPKKADPRVQFQAELLQCWQNFGIESDKCRDVEMKLDHAENEYNKSGSQFNSKQLITEIKATLNKPLYRSLTKGRHRDLGQRPYNIYDGLDGLL